MTQKFKVEAIRETRTTFIIEANSASAAINKARTSKGIDVKHSFEEHFYTKDLGEESE